MFFGKIIAAVLGLLMFGLPGAVLGLIVGHWFDRGLRNSFSFASPERLAKIRQAFFETTFLLLGHVAKSDGHISQAEVAHTEEIMRQLALGAEQRQTAITLFKRGSQASFNLPDTLANFNEACRGQRQLQQTLLVFLVSLALADGGLDAAEREVLGRVASQLGYSAVAFSRLLEMVVAQSHFHRSGGGGGAAAPNLLNDAYKALGVESDIDDRGLKQAYRRLMSQHHPDKLIARGVPEDMLKVATARSQDIQAAYELIKKTRIRSDR